MPYPKQEEIQTDRLDSSCLFIESDGRIDYDLCYIQSESDKLATQQECLRFLNSIDYNEAIRNLLIDYLEDVSTKDVLKVSLLKQIITNPAIFCRMILHNVTEKSDCIDNKEKKEYYEKDDKKNDLQIIRDFNKYCLTQTYEDDYPLHFTADGSRK